MAKVTSRSRTYFAGLLRGNEFMVRLISKEEKMAFGGGNSLLDRELHKSSGSLLWRRIL